MVDATNSRPELQQYAREVAAKPKSCGRTVGPVWVSDLGSVKISMGGGRRDRALAGHPFRLCLDASGVHAEFDDEAAVDAFLAAIGADEQDPDEILDAILADPGVQGVAQHLVDCREFFAAELAAALRDQAAGTPA